MNNGRPPWDANTAESLDGALVLVGVTVEAAGETEQHQFYGTVISVDEHSGIVVRLDGKRSGETYTLPPDLRSFSPARPGEYRLRSIGEIVKDPDFIAQWTMTRPGN